MADDLVPDDGIRAGTLHPCPAATHSAAKRSDVAGRRDQVQRVSKAMSRSSFHLMDFSSGAAALDLDASAAPVGFAAPVRSTSGACASEGTCEKRAVRLVDGRWLQLG